MRENVVEKQNCIWNWVSIQIYPKNSLLHNFLYPQVVDCLNMKQREYITYWMFMLTFCSK